MPDHPHSAPDPVTVGGPAFLCLRSDAHAMTWVTVRGELDVATVPEVRRMLSGAQADAATVVLDLRELDFIDSAGTQLVLAAHQRARAEGGRLMIVRGPEVAWYFDISGLDEELELADRPPTPESLRATA